MKSKKIKSYINLLNHGEIMKVIMPKLGMRVEDITLVKWYKKEGDAVEKGEPLFAVETEKITKDVEAPSSGTLSKILVREGETVPIGTTVGIIGEEMREISAEKAREKAAHEVETLTGIRRTIAERMSESWKAPHVNLAIQVNASELVRARQTLLPSFREKGGKVTYTDFLIEAIAKTIEKFPEVNSGYEEGSIKRFAEINIGVGVAIKDGLIVPVIHNANKKSLFEIAKEREELVKKARDRTLSKQDIEEGTFTLTNLGMYGIDFFTAVLNPPQAAELSVGRIDEKPVVEKGEMVIRPMMCLVLIIDHRVLDGAKGAEFLGELKKKIEAPRV